MAKAFFKNDNLYSLSVPGFKIPGIILKPGKYVSGNYYLTEYARYGLTYVGDDVAVDPIEDLIYDYVEVLTGADMTPAAPEGLATLDATGNLDLDQLPQLAISDTYVVADQAARLALDVQTGDVAIQTDNSKTYILAAEPATENTNWKELAAASGILGAGAANELPYWINATNIGSITGSSWNSGSSTLGLPNGATLLTDVLRIGAHTDPANYERLSLSTIAGTGGTLALESAGTGVDALTLGIDALSPGSIIRLRTRNSADNVTSVLTMDDSGYIILANAYSGNTTAIGGNYAIDVTHTLAFRADSAFGALVSGYVALNDTSAISWSNGAWYGTKDIGLARSSAGVVKVTDGSTGIGALLSSVKVTANTGTATPGVTDSKTVYTNAGDADGSAITLPSAAAGLEYTVCVTDPQTVTVTAASGDNIRVVSNPSATAGNVSSNTVGSVLRLVAIDSTTWLAVSVLGTWSVN